MNDSKATLFSFGYKYGPPTDINFLVDVRFLPNPYYDEDLRPYSGLQQAVADYVLNNQQADRFISAVSPLLTVLNEESGSEIRIAVGCTGGRHRSVAIVEHLRKVLENRGGVVETFHRDIDNDSVSG
ncbi:MAG: RNase adapter RapZ [Thermodesulfobacteriota bacterium]